VSDETDRIERSTMIDADAQRVWQLVAEPGWWINDGTIVPHRIERDGDVAVVHDPVHGAFAIRTVRLDPPHYAAFRWISAPGVNGPTPEQSTLVEFLIEERSPSGVLLRVVESGLDALELSEQQRRILREDNTAGWETELAAARMLLTAA
jgi:uncharacterized protein YndB with AHSA1/START domain